MNRRRYYAIVSVIVATVVAAIGGIWWWATADGEPPALTAQAAAEIAADLQSGDPERVLAALAMPDGTQVSGETAEAMARYIVSIDVAMFEHGPDGTATAAGTVQVVDQPGTATEVRLFLVYVDGRWRLVDAVPVDAGPVDRQSEP